jgi:hypothetical protein
LTNKYDEYLKEWNIGRDSIQRQYDQYRSIAEIKNMPPSKDPFLEGLDRIIYSHQQIPNREEFQIIQDNYVTPIKDYCVRNFIDPRAVVLIPFCLKATAAFVNRRDLLMSASQFYSEGASNLQNKVDNIKLTIDLYTKGSTAAA